MIGVIIFSRLFRNSIKNVLSPKKYIKFLGI